MTEKVWQDNWLILGNSNRGDLITFSVASTVAVPAAILLKMEADNPSLPINSGAEDLILGPIFACTLLSGAVAVAAGSLIINRNVRAFFSFLKNKKEF